MLGIERNIERWIMDVSEVFKLSTGQEQLELVNSFLNWRNALHSEVVIQ